MTTIIVRQIVQYLGYQMQQFFARPVWKKGEIIRDISNGKPWLVKHVFIDSGTWISDPENRTAGPTPVLFLDPCDYDHYTRDLDMDYEENPDGEREWSYKPVTI